MSLNISVKADFSPAFDLINDLRITQDKVSRFSRVLQREEKMTAQRAINARHRGSESWPYKFIKTGRMYAGVNSVLETNARGRGYWEIMLTTPVRDPKTGFGYPGYWNSIHPFLNWSEPELTSHYEKLLGFVTGDRGR